MNKQERLQNAIESKSVDRVPISVWSHFSAIDYDPYKLAEATAAFAKKYDFDSIKMMPFGLYSVEDLGAQIEFFKVRGKKPAVKVPGITKTSDYLKLPDVDVTRGTYGNQLIFTDRLRKLLPAGTPYIQTLFSPLTILHKLLGDDDAAFARLRQDIESSPEAVRKALETITGITIRFVEESIKLGVSGFFFATRVAGKGFLSEEAFRSFAVPYDLAVLKSFTDKTWLNVVHLHGLDVYFEEVAAKYPNNVINWHDRNTPPSLAEARRLTRKALLGGIAAADTVVDGKRVRDDIIVTGTPAEITAHIREAIESVDGTGLIIGPGCGIGQFASEENILAARRAVEL